MNLLLINQDWFAAEFRAAGHHVVTAGPAAHLDFPINAPLIHIDRIIQECMNGTTPDAIIVHDNSAPLMVQGFDETLIPTIFYSVDTHHHVDLHKYLSHLFDEVMVAQKDYLPAFHEQGFDPLWLPLWASRDVQPSDDKIYGAVFVGTLNPKLNPDRVRFFEALKERAPVHFQAGNFWEIFPRAEIVINQTVKGDLNFRVFEAMLSGTALLTERSPNGLFELFEDGKHLVTYTKNDVEEAAAMIHSMLHDKVRTKEIGRIGREEIQKKHLPIHRAEKVLEILKNIRKKPSKLKFFTSLANFASLAVKMEKHDTGISGRALVAALKAGDYGLRHQEELPEEIACFAIIACLRYEAILKTGAAADFLAALAESYPQSEVLTLALVRQKLNQGDIGGARTLAQRIATEDETAVFLRSESFVGELLTLSGVMAS